MPRVGLYVRHVLSLRAGTLDKTGQVNHDLLPAVGLVLTVQFPHLFQNVPFSHPGGNLVTCICSAYHSWVFCPLICTNLYMGPQQEQGNWGRFPAGGKELKRSSLEAVAREHIIPPSSQSKYLCSVCCALVSA